MNSIILSKLQHQPGDVTITDPSKLHLVLDPPRDNLRQWARAVIIYIDGDKYWTVGYSRINVIDWVGCAVACLVPNDSQRQVVALHPIPAGDPGADPTG